MCPAETMEGSLDKNDFMDVFYNQFMEKLIAPVSGDTLDAASSGKGKAAPAAAAAAASGNINNSSSSSPPTAVAAADSCKGSSSSVPASTVGLIVDLLCFCVQHHAFWAKYHVLR